MKFENLLLALACILMVMVFLLPPSNAPDVEEYARKEAYYQQKIAWLERRVKVLDSRDVAWSKLVEATRDTLRSERAVVGKLKREYVKAQVPVRYSVEELDSVFGLPVAGDQLPVGYTLPVDTVNALLNDRSELAAARRLIVHQEELINMGLRYESASDSLLSIRLKSILARDSIIYSERERFTNMVEMKDAALRHERREKRRWKAAAFVIGTFAVLEKIFSP